MTVKELRQLLQGADPEAELVCVRDIPSIGKAEHKITGVAHRTKTDADGEVTSRDVVISIETLGYFDLESVEVEKSAEVSEGEAYNLAKKADN